MKSRPPPTLNIQRKSLMLAWNILPILILWLHVIISPYTKVEESFTLHAVHDVLVHGWRNVGRWDHVEFPGAVPRSFLPSLGLGAVCWPVVRVGLGLGVIRSKVHVQIVVRLTLSLLSALSLAQLSKALRFRFGPLVRLFFVLLTLTQFHIPYYSGRTLPNFMALPGVYLAMAWIIRAGAGTIPAPIRRKRVRGAVALMTFLATNTRLELAALVLPMTAGMVLSGMIRVGDAVLAGAVGGFGALIISGPIDYYLWSHALPHPSLPTFTSPCQTIWPELASMHYNLIQGQADNWGVMSRHYYITNSLPKLLMGSLPLAGLAVLWSIAGRVGVIRRFEKESAVWEVGVKSGLGVGAGMMVLGLSAVGHKEWRFVVYVVPIVTVLASFAAANLWTNSPRRMRPLVRLGLVGVLVLQVAASGFMTYLSANNYPGGEVWKALDELQGDSIRPITIHFSSYPLQTGSSLFTFIHDSTPLSIPSKEMRTITAPGSISFPPQWTYSKSEDPELLTPEGAAEAGVEYVVLESGTEGTWLGPSASDTGEGVGGWKVVKKIEALKGVKRGGKYGLKVEWADRIVILARR